MKSEKTIERDFCSGKICYSNTRGLAKLELRKYRGVLAGSNKKRVLAYNFGDVDCLHIREILWN